MRCCALMSQSSTTFLPTKMNNSTWRGYPLRCWPNHQDDCYRWDWEIQIDGKWLEIVTQATRFIEAEAEEALRRHQQKKGKKCG